MGVPENLGKLLSSNRFIAITLLIVYILLITLSNFSEDYVRELFNSPKETISTISEDSYLQDELISKDQLSNHWRWHNIHTVSFIYDPSEENDYPIEMAVREFSGLYNWKKASIRQYIEEYDSRTDLLANAERYTKWELSIDGYTPDNWMPDIYIDEYDSYVKCASNSVEYKCVITDFPDKKVITLVFELKSKPDDKELIEEISRELFSLIK